MGWVKKKRTYGQRGIVNCLDLLLGQARGKGLGKLLSLLGIRHGQSVQELNKQADRAAETQ
jgi:hypothetical protein